MGAENKDQNDQQANQPQQQPEAQTQQKQEWQSYTSGNRTTTMYSRIEGDTFEKVSLQEAIARVEGIVKDNEKKMKDAFENAPEWQSRKKLEMKTFRVDATGAENTKKEIHTLVKIPPTFTKVQREALKEYAKKLGGSYQNMKVVTKLADGTEKQTFPAQIEFGKGNAYSADICARFILGDDPVKLLETIKERAKISEERKQAQSQSQSQSQEQSQPKVEQKPEAKPKVEQTKTQTPKPQKKQSGPKL